MTTFVEWRSLPHVSRRLLLLGSPLAVGFVAQMAISFTDAAIVARLGATELAAVTLALSIFSLVMLFGLGLVTGASPGMARAWHRHDPTRFAAWFKDGNWLSVIVGLVGAVALLQTGQILTILGQSESVASLAQSYNAGAALGLPFFLLYVNSRSAIAAMGLTRSLGLIMLAAVALNGGLTYMAVIGFGRIGGYGVAGAGWSSTLTRLSIVILTLSVIWRQVAKVDFSARGLWGVPRWASLLQLAKLGLPIGLRILLGEGFLPVLAFLVAGFGVSSISAHAVGLNIIALVSVVSLGFSSAATTMAAWAAADEEPLAVAKLRAALLVVGGGYVLAFSVIVVIVFPFLIQDIFGVVDPSTRRALDRLLPLLVGYFILDTFATIFNGFLVGLVDTWLPTMVVLISYWVVALTVGVLLAFTTPLAFNGLWVGLCVGASLVAAFNLFRSSAHARAAQGAAAGAGQSLST